MSWLNWNNKSLRLMIGWLWIAAITLAVYCNTFTAPFIYDDMGSAVDNKNIEQLWPIWKCLVPAKLSTISGRPVVALSLAINYAISQQKVWSYHVFNAGVHIACALLLLLLLTRVFASEASPARIRPHAQVLAMSVTFVWAVHPLLTESVIYIVQRTEMIASFFYLLTIYCAAQAYETPPESRGVRRTWFALAVISCALGMASKEVMLSAPLAVLVYDRLFLHRAWGSALRQWRGFYICLASTSFILFAILAASPRGDTVGFDDGIYWLHYLYTQAWVIALYIKLSFIPIPLSIVYDYPLTEHLSQAALPGAFIVLAIVLTIRGLITGRAAAMAGAVFFMVLAPSSSFIPIVTEVAGERRMYLPLAMVLAVVAGVAANALAWACEKAPRLGSPAPAIAAAALTLAALGSYETFERAKDFRSPESIWRDTVSKAPGHPVVWNNLGITVGVLNRLPESAACFLKASELHSAIPNMYVNYVSAKAHYAVLLGMLGQFEASRRDAEAILVNAPLQPTARLALALYYLEKKQLADAIWQCDISVMANEFDNDAWAVRARILTRLGRYLEAAASLDSALRLRPQAPVNTIVADELASIGPDASKVAIPALEHLVKAVPDKAAPRLALARALGDVGRLDECVEQFRIALTIEPDNLTLWQNYASALARCGRYPDVVRALEHVVELSPNDASAHSRLGLALARTGRMQDAVAQWNRAIELDPNDADARANLLRQGAAPTRP